MSNSDDDNHGKDGPHPLDQTTEFPALTDAHAADESPSTDVPPPAPEQSAPEQSAPEQSAPEQSAPEQSAPDDQTSRNEPTSSHDRATSTGQRYSAETERLDPAPFPAAQDYPQPSYAPASTANRAANRSTAFDEDTFVDEPHSQRPFGGDADGHTEVIPAYNSTAASPATTALPTVAAPAYPPAFAEMPAHNPAPAYQPTYAPAPEPVAANDLRFEPQPLLSDEEDDGPKVRRGPGSSGGLAVLGLAAAAVGAFGFPLQSFRKQGVFFGNLHELAGGTGADKKLIGTKFAGDWWHLYGYGALGILTVLVALMVTVPGVWRRIAAMLVLLGGLGCVAGFLYAGHGTNNYDFAVVSGKAVRLGITHFVYGYVVAVTGCAVVALSGLLLVFRRGD
jgi:hypothetical protein